MLSTTLGRALRTTLTLACALAALAVVAGPAAASELLPSTGQPPVLTVLGSTYDATDNDYSIDLGGSLTVDLEIEARELEQGLEGLPGGIFCEGPEEAGIYAVFGLLTEPWRPSRGAPSRNRRGGLSVWANEHGAATVPITERGCGGATSPFPGQVRYSVETRSPFRAHFLTSTTLTFCQSGGTYVLTGRSIGANGAPTTYLIPSTTGVWHLYTLGAFGSVQGPNEEVVNLRFTGFQRESAACPAL